ncbi:MAG: hypothetical protein PHH26_00315 [Candidatus Thermoplasmatota archaeon]|nr:hypothetical protein [Candidatus Thermoplasmatota archaeon]
MKDADRYGKPYVWRLTLDDFEEDLRIHADGGAVCPIIENTTCGHPWSFCKTCYHREVN